MFRLGVSTSREDDVGRPLSARIASVAYSAMAYWFYRWDWGESIAIDGLWMAGSTVGNRAFTDFAVAEAQGWVGASAAGAGLNPMGPAGVLLNAIERGLVDRPDEAERQLVRLADRIADDGHKIGGLSPHGPDDVVFVDSLYGYPAFLVRLGLRTGRKELVDSTLTLTARHCQLLQDERTGLFAHFAQVQGRRAGAVAWGRGNGWAVLGLSDLLEVTPPDHLARDHVRSCLVAALDGLRPMQASDGSWRNIVDQPSSYPESSTTAMIEAGTNQAVASGSIDSSYATIADAAWRAIEHRIDTSGHLVGVSYRPGVNEDPRRYEHTPAVGCYPWGQGAYLRSACGRVSINYGRESRQ